MGGEEEKERNKGRKGGGREFQKGEGKFGKINNKIIKIKNKTVQKMN